MIRFPLAARLGEGIITNADPLQSLGLKNGKQTATVYNCNYGFFNGGSAFSRTVISSCGTCPGCRKG